MDSDRKYRQNGYMDSDRDSKAAFAKTGPKPQGPRPPLDVTGPRLPRLVQHVAAARCFNCATTLPAGIDLTGNCPKCNAELHCCKQCSHFEPSTRFQCLKPIPVRIPVKDKANDCTLVYAPRNGCPRRHGRRIGAPAVSRPQRGSARSPQRRRRPQRLRQAFQEAITAGQLVNLRPTADRPSERSSDFFASVR